MGFAAHRVECRPDMVFKVLEKLILGALPVVPGPLMRRLSSRYIAGETLAQALTKADELAECGYDSIIDLLGEDISDEAEARAVLAAYKSAADALHERKLDSYVSIKPTHFGLRFSRELARELYTDLLEHCASLGQMARVEMEDHTTTDDTLQLFAELRERFDNVGIVLQSRLFRTLADIDKLPGKKVDVRMVKGIYLEPASIAHTGAQEIRDAFVEGVVRLLDNGHSVALATHDESLAARALHEINTRSVPPDRYCFEVLLGVQQRLWERWKSGGHQVRVYIPYGPEWRAYSQRRLKKNPEILRHLIRNMLGGA
ncbi:MAG: proline dehydrogenase [Chlamydiales bacterium]|jgi:proline dehydrogenase